MSKLIQLPAARTEAALEYATTRYALLMSQETITPAQMHSFLVQMGSDLIGWSKLGKAVYAGADMLKASAALAKAQASLAELEAKEAKAA